MYMIPLILLTLYLELNLQGVIMYMIPLILLTLYLELNLQGVIMYIYVIFSQKNVKYYIIVYICGL